MTDVRITQVNFTWSLPGGMWIKTSDGETEYVSFGQLRREQGDEEADRLIKKATRYPFTGQWHDVK